MQVIVQTISGKHLVLDVESMDEVASLVAINDGIANFRIESDLHLVIDAEGGKKKKRKKKAFTTKKRVPHTRKKEKLKLLKLFKVKGDSVEALRQVCPNCPGSFMAKHKDGRLYCGNCHTNQA